ncbi:securin [Echeneis naucrates]|uniref:securin n=1 Tax=Echeneis naucrates TaxID=173247 RepID=UPI001113A9FB|nr:securin-like [Echeneis naucrates]XP_029368331.1 securin-like [Echeneis naucrates]
MANIIFAEPENLRVPSLKLRQRLQSAPERILKSPMIAKTPTTPLLSGRKAFGTINKIIPPSAVTTAEGGRKVQLQRTEPLNPQAETQTKHTAHCKVEEYPEIEKFIPYNPLDFEKYSIPEDLVCISGMALPGLACFPKTPHACEEDLEKLDPLPELSPVKMPKASDYCLELDAFLQTLEQIIELPPEPVTD